MPRQSQLRILIVAKQNKAGIHAARKLEKLLKEYTEDIHFDLSTVKKAREAKGTPVRKFDGDFVITVGGDGTLLWTAQQTNKPILPVRIEGYGFLCTADFKELVENIKKLINRDFSIQERMRLSCTKVTKGKIERYLRLRRSYPAAANEIVFARKRPSKILTIEFTIDDTVFEFSGDGILISTPHGSSAYAASAGGPLVDTSLDVISVVPLYPFYSKIKPFIMPASKKIHVKIKAGECAVIMDGHGGDYVSSEADFLIEKGEPLRIVSLFKSSFYERFKKKFM
ncbi:MAG: NAD(+)/NADH kinase [Candidatus Aenigmarchaeota archaeon]|nr:NAD(+)/NADH kinase [Candidatus Aenigmarchaeota archaeon]